MVSQLRAEWALWGKEQADAIGYRVLACSSGELDQREFSEFMSTALTGSPSGAASARRSLPWLTIAPLRTSVPWLGVSITEASEISDATRRPVFPTRSYCFPFADLRSRPATYGGLAEAALGRALPVGEVEPVPLNYVPFDADRITNMIENDVGFDRAARAAALVVQGQTVVTGAAELSLGGKLDVLDAVASLLPYGIRSRLAVSTWANSISAHRMRLCFSDAAAPGQTALLWGHPASEVVVGDSTARAYLDRLVVVYERFGLERLVEFLQTHRAPMTLDDPETLIRPLEDLCRPFIVAERARAGAATVSEVLEVVETGAAAALTTDERLEVLRFLVRRVGPADVGVVSAYWVPELWGDLVRVFLESIAAGAASSGLAGYLGLARQVGDVDELIAAAVRSGDRGRPSQTALSVVSDALWPWPHDFVATRAALLEDRGFVYALLADEAGSRESVYIATLIAWLQAGSTSEPDLEAFEKVVVDSGVAVTSHDLRTVEATAVKGTEALVETALKVGRPERVLSALLESLPRWLAAASTTECARWEGLLKRVEQKSSLDAGEAARLDLARVLANERTTVDVSQRFSREVVPVSDPYILSFCDALSSIVSPTAHSQIVRWGPTILTTGDDDLVERCLVLLRGIGKGSRRTEEVALNEAILTLIESSPDLIEASPTASWWWDEIGKIGSLSRRVALVEFVRGLKGALPTRAIADLYVTALKSGAREEDLSRALSRRSPRLSTRAIAELRPLLEERLRIGAVPRAQRRATVEAFDRVLTPAGRRAAVAPPKGHRSDAKLWSPEWSPGRRANLVFVAALLVLVGAGASAVVGVMRNPAPRGQATLAATERAAIETAYQSYWASYLAALRDLRPRGLGDVMQGRALDQARAEVRQRAIGGRSTIITPLDHRWTIDALDRDVVRLVAHYVVDVAGSPPAQERVRGSGTFTMQKARGVWKVVDVSSSVLQIGEPLPRERVLPTRIRSDDPLDAKGQLL